MTPVDPIEDLRWLFHDSAAALGVSAIDYRDLAGTQSHDDFAGAVDPEWLSPPAPPAHRIKDATRQRRLLAAFRELSDRHQAAICHAYEPRCLTPAHLRGSDDVSEAKRQGDRHYDDARTLIARYGIAANLVRLVLDGRSVHDPSTAPDVEHVVGVLLEAHEAFRTITRERKRRDRPEPPSEARLAWAAGRT